MLRMHTQHARTHARSHTRMHTHTVTKTRLEERIKDTYLRMNCSHVLCTCKRIGKLLRANNDTLELTLKFIFLNFSAAVDTMS
jgi:hypothetical protein